MEVLIDLGEFTNVAEVEPSDNMDVLWIGGDGLSMSLVVVEIDDVVFGRVI